MNKLRRSALLFGLALMGAMASANMAALDATISIDKALNSPTLTVKYSGANVSLIDLRVNGESVATRSVSSDKDNGETNFTLDLSTLKDGDNVVEVRLYNKAGNIVGSEKTVISTDDGTPAPFFLSSPKMGETVQGPVELSVGFNKSFTSSFVSFFIDNQLRSMSNNPPYNYIWDTSRETNGWHEVESFLVDDSNTTYKTKKVRIFINNPAGHTNRQVEPRQGEQKVDLTPKTNPTTGNVLGSATGPKALPDAGQPKLVTDVHPTATAPLDLVPSVGSLKAGIAGSVSGLKPTKVGGALATGPKFLTPTGKRLAANFKVKNQSVTAAGVAPKVGGAMKLMEITHGSRLPNVGAFSVLMNGEFVNFDVTPRVDEGVPMTPLRFLFEKDGGKVAWNSEGQTVTATVDGRDIFVKIGDVLAKINLNPVQMERAAYLENGRTVVPLSFIRDALNVDVQYDAATGHVLITSLKK